MTPLLAALLLTSTLEAGTSEPAEQARREAQRRFKGGLALMQGESWDEAEVELRRAVALDPLHFLAHYALGQAHMARKRYPDAATAYADCLRIWRELAALRVSNRFEVERRRDDSIQQVRDVMRDLRQQSSSGNASQTSA